MTEQEKEAFEALENLVETQAEMVNNIKTILNLTANTIKENDYLKSAINGKVIMGLGISNLYNGKGE